MIQLPYIPRADETDALTRCVDNFRDFQLTQKSHFVPASLTSERSARTPTLLPALSRILTASSSQNVRLLCYTDRINDKFVTAKTNTLKWIDKFSGEMPPPVSLARLYALHQDRRSAR